MRRLPGLGRRLRARALGLSRGAGPAGGLGSFGADPEEDPGDLAVPATLRSHVRNRRALGRSARRRPSRAHHRGARFLPTPVRSNSAGGAAAHRGVAPGGDLRLRGRLAGEATGRRCARSRGASRGRAPRRSQVRAGVGRAARAGAGNAAGAGLRGSAGRCAPRGGQGAVRRLRKRGAGGARSRRRYACFREGFQGKRAEPPGAAGGVGRGARRGGRPRGGRRGNRPACA